MKDMRLDYIPDSRFEAPSNEDEGEEGFQVVVRKKHDKKKTQMYSEACKYSFRCKRGFLCTYFHSPQEAEFFKIQPDSNVRLTYKHRVCEHYMGLRGTAGCKFKGAFSYLCSWAHGTYCLICKCDDDGGHNLHKCPETSKLARNWIMPFAEPPPFFPPPHPFPRPPPGF
jgi:hypothetical protein